MHLNSLFPRSASYEGVKQTPLAIKAMINIAMGSATQVSGDASIITSGDSATKVGHPLSYHVTTAYLQIP